MKKLAQMYAAQLSGVTLHDLYRAIARSVSLSQQERTRVIQQIRGVTGAAPPPTPLSSLMSRGLGGVAGYLISRYLGMRPVGRVVGGALGVGIGKLLHDQYNRPKSPMPGWRVL